MARLLGGSRLSESRNCSADGSSRSRWRRPSKHSRILTDGSRRTAARWSRAPLRKHPMGTRRQLAPSALWESHLLEFQLIVLRGKNHRSHRLQAERKETCSLTPRGGFLDGRNQNRDPEPSAKPLRHSDKPTNLEMLFLRSGSTYIKIKDSYYGKPLL